MWPETVRLIHRELLRRGTLKTDEPLIVTENGERLVRWLDNGQRVDTVGQLFTQHRGRAGVSQLGFKHLEKTAANLIAQEYGAEIASTFVSHGRPIGNIDPIIYNYTNKRFDKLAEATEWLRDKLSPVFGDRDPANASGLRLAL